MTPIFLVLLVAIDPIIAQDLRDPPKILTRPRSQHVKAGGIASFYCSAHGAPPPQIHWRKNGKKVSPTATRYNTKTYANGALLRIDPVRAQRDDAMWECVAENGVGDAVTAEAQLTVHEQIHPVLMDIRVLSSYLAHCCLIYSPIFTGERAA